jgi:hypothetical protein
LAGVSVNNQMSVDKSAPEAKYYTVVAGDTLSRSQDPVRRRQQVYDDLRGESSMLQHPDKIYPASSCGFRRRHEREGPSSANCPEAR